MNTPQADDFMSGVDPSVSWMYMIQVILNYKSWSESFQRNVCLDPKIVWLKDVTGIN